MEEVWKPIEGYDGFYEVSNLGRVRSYMPPANVKYARRDTPLIMTPQRNDHGYMVIALIKNRTRKVFRIHRLVASAFIEKVDGKYYVNHIDGDKTNNNVDNLEWCTRSENMVHAFKTGLVKVKTGKDSSRARTVMMYDMKGNFIRCFDSAIEAARYCGRKDQSNISACCRGSVPHSYGYLWRYADE
jgi:hypothetical protein